MQQKLLPPNSQCMIVVNLPEAEATTAQEGEAKAVLQRTHKLKETPVRFLTDLDPDQRSKLKTALEELRERRAKGKLIGVRIGSALRLLYASYVRPRLVQRAATRLIIGLRGTSYEGLLPVAYRAPGETSSI
ncbi:unnamed protein product [Echinostoma caproni]|uniref:Smr domain-containing protein n=1 Tax=Echinostoma caproni TaxID=27848 RepID=A0A183A6V5_9TREM|nr:unnamed protein product [Echinostoma caproni]